MEEKKLAKQFHDTYERLAPQFGYETREDTKEFEEDSPNGKLMIAVCKEVMLKELDRAREEGIREGLEDILSEVENWKTHYLDTTKSEPSKTMQIGLVNVIRKMLSKLTTK